MGLGGTVNSIETPPPSGADEASPLFRRAVFLATVVLVSAALGASTVLLVDYLRPAPMFCGEGGGCGALKHTDYAAWFGIPTPMFGVAGFLTLGVLSMLRGEIVRFVNLGVATCGAAFAAYLIFLQLTLHHICPYCMVTDVSSIGLAVLAVLRLRNDVDGPRDAPKATLVAFAYVVAFTAPVALSAANKPKLPPVVADEIRATPTGKITIVDFADFECPFCRKTHASLFPLLATYPGRFRVARKQVPLPIHPHAMDAAKAACCAERMGKGDDMADRLFTAPPDDLTPDGCVQLASTLGLDAKAFRACLDDPQIAAHIEEDRAAFKTTGARGLPTIFINTQRIEGAQPLEVYDGAIKKELGE